MAGGTGDRKEADQVNDRASQVATPPAQFGWLRRIAVALVLGILLTLAIRNRDALSLDSLVRQQDALRTAVDERPLLVLGSAFLLYVAVTGLSLPGAALMTLVYGWLFGFWRGVVLISFASTAGATVAFLTSRFLFRDLIQARFRDRLAKFNAALAREGAFYLFTLRLVPQVPFFLVNLLMGLTPVRTSTFWWVSQLGMLPGTCLYVYAGASVGSLDALRDKGLSGILTWKLALAFTLLGVFPLLAKRLMSILTRRSVNGSISLPK
ncbi:MAG: TVP38/TMEM64 family protein [Planctomycetes bacterium]|nr:TVP38/TMEM64 family protein [Planctomycetota bacterium]